jgi:hypothetical protein
MSHSQQPPGPPRQPAYPGQTPYPPGMAPNPYAYTPSTQPTDPYRTAAHDAAHHLPSMRTLDTLPSQHGLAPPGPPTMAMGMTMTGAHPGLGSYYNTAPMNLPGQYLPTEMLRYPLPPHDPRFQMGRGPKKVSWRRIEQRDLGDQQSDNHSRRHTVKPTPTHKNFVAPLQAARVPGAGLFRVRLLISHLPV